MYYSVWINYFALTKTRYQWEYGFNSGASFDLKDREFTHMETAIKHYSMGEEIANSITHGIGVLLAIAALGILTAFAGVYGNVWHIVSVSIYGTTLVLLYTASTLYHSIQQPQAKYILQILDHSAIYLLIAGTYTPFTLVSLRGPWGWWLFGVIWSLAVLGLVFQLSRMRRWRGASLCLYIGMGWVIVVAIKPLIVSVPTGGIGFLVLGGLAYTAGVVFYSWKKLKFHHAIWHLFVLAGSTLHFFAVLFYVVPISG
jgi:hemolysin III